MNFIQLTFPSTMAATISGEINPIALPLPFASPFNVPA